MYSSNFVNKTRGTYACPNNKISKLLLFCFISLVMHFPFAGYTQVTATIEDLLSVELKQDPITIELFPNPATNYIKIAKPSNVNIQRIDIFNSSGESIYSEATTTKEFIVENIPPGLYYFRIIADEHTVLKSLFVSES